MVPIPDPARRNGPPLFGAVFVISKKGEHERKRTIRTALEQSGIAHEFFDAIMGADLTDAEVAAIYDEERALNHKTISRKLHVSNIGCSLSHLRVYAEIGRRGLSSALVLEDDAQPLAERLTGLERSIKELPPDWDVLYLGVRGHRRPPLSYWPKLYLMQPFARLVRPRKYRLTHAEVSRLYMRPYSKWLDRAGYHQGTHAYAVSRKGAEILYARGEHVDAPADVYLSTLIIEGKLNAFAVREDMFTTTGATSQIVNSL